MHCGTGLAEVHAEQYAEQYLGCAACRESRHATSFCQHCGQCFFCLMRERSGRVWHTDVGTVVHCPCGESTLWD